MQYEAIAATDRDFIRMLGREHGKLFTASDVLTIHQAAGDDYYKMKQFIINFF